MAATAKLHGIRGLYRLVTREAGGGSHIARWPPPFGGVRGQVNVIARAVGPGTGSLHANSPCGGLEEASVR